MSSTITKAASPFSERQYATALKKSIQLENQGDYLVKAGKPEMGIRKYQQSLALREKLFGQNHVIVQYFQGKIDAIAEVSDDASRSSDSKNLDWTYTKSSPGYYSLVQSLKYVQDGDRIMKQLSGGAKSNENNNKAQKSYTRAYDIEKRVLGKNHPRVMDIESKILRSACPVV